VTVVASVDEALEGPGYVVMIVLELTGQTNSATTVDLSLPTSGDAMTTTTNPS